MSLDLLLTNGDLDLRSEFADTRTSAPLVAQQIDTVLNVAVGEWPSNVTEGFPWLAFGLDSHILTPELFRSAVADALTLIPEVVVTSIKAKKENRIMTCVIEARIRGQRFQGQLFSTDPSRRDSQGGNELFAVFVPVIYAS